MTEQHTRFFTEQEAKDLIWEAEVSQSSNGSGRWSEYMSSVVEADDGKLYRIDWESGLTESQENLYFSGDYPEVTKYVHFRSQKIEDYYTVEELQKLQEDKSGVVQEELDSLRLVSDADVDAFRSPETQAEIQQALELFEKLAALDPIQNFEAARHSAIQYLTTLQKVNRDLDA